MHPEVAAGLLCELPRAKDSSTTLALLGSNIDDWLAYFSLAENLSDDESKSSTATTVCLASYDTT